LQLASILLSANIFHLLQKPHSATSQRKEKNPSKTTKASNLKSTPPKKKKKKKKRKLGGNECRKVAIPNFQRNIYTLSLTK
jgi:hypothetical protein